MMKPLAALESPSLGEGVGSHPASSAAFSALRSYASYRDFFNILARFSNGVPKHYEIIHPYHKDWLKICKAAPYWVFDYEQSRFKLDNPLHVATYIETFETWHSSPDQQQVGRLKDLLFPDLPTGCATRWKQTSSIKEKEISN